MDLSLTEEQEMIKSATREFVQQECDKRTLLALDKTETGFSPETWKKAAELGWLGMFVPEQYGGEGTCLTDVAVLFEELGRAPVFGPFFSSGVLSNLIILEAGTEEQKQQILPTISKGERIVTLAVTEPDYGWGPESVRMTAEPKNGGFVLNGVKLFVYDAVGSSHFICAVRTAQGGSPSDGVTLLMVDKQSPGISVRTLPGWLTRCAEVKFESTEVPASAVLGEIGQGWPALERAFMKATPILCAYMVGGCQSVFDMSVEYSRTRIQFGQPIGRFQRVQDHIIDLSLRMDPARWTTYEAVSKLDAGKPDVASSVHLAKIVASEGYHWACLHAHEVTAGTGSTIEFGLVLHTRLSRTLFDYLGGPDFHRERLAEVLAL
ncbi:MAG: acyl-CoA dehydrogenase family protein [Pseudomonadota bacterium]